MEYDLVKRIGRKLKRNRTKWDTEPKVNQRRKRRKACAASVLKREHRRAVKLGSRESLKAYAKRLHGAFKVSGQWVAGDEVPRIIR